MAEFAKRVKNEPKYPTRTFDGQVDQSYGFTDARKLQTGTLRGSQVIANTDGSKIILGKIPGTNDFGIAFYDATVVLISAFTGVELTFYHSSKNETLTLNGTTLSVNDVVTGENRMQIGKLPDSTYGWAISATGYDVADGIS